MKLKKRTVRIYIYLLILLITLGVFNYYKIDYKPFISDSGIKYSAKIEDNAYKIYKDGEFKEIFLKGVNIGAGKPGSWPGDLDISEGTYYRWFHYISEMNADVIRVYTTMKPEFYNALYRFNFKNDNPLYLIHGVWVREEDINELADGHNSIIKDRFIKDGKDIVDVIHGNTKLNYEKGVAYGKYNKDISEYVIGWILGIEWYPDFVIGTNENNKDINNYKGNYIYVEEAPAFECFLAEVGDKIIEYETENYKTQRPLAFSNWPTTDTISQPNEPSDVEDIVSFDSELINFTDKFETGMFASYHVYPYYPDFLNYNLDYREFVDENGDVNTYRAYLKELKKQHKKPIMISEYGVPSSRGKTHDDIHRGFNQGQNSETQQGNMNAALLNDIYKEGYVGAILFVWQDEWFKRTWNTMDYDVKDRRPYWSNTQTNEQNFGLLAFDPGIDKSIVYVDGEINEWRNVNPIINENNFKLWVQSDEKYIYFRVYKENFNPKEEIIFIPVNTINNQGNLRSEKFNLSFDKEVDFLIRIDGEENSTVLIDSYYDTFYYTYAKELFLIEENEKYENKNSGIFNNINLALNKALYLPEEDKVIPISYYDTGKLKYGIANPENEEYNSLNDFYYSGDNIEIKIPWALLNVSDPSTHQIIDDFYTTEPFSHKFINNFEIGLILRNSETIYTDYKEYKWSDWETPTYHERLKKSYFIMKEAFEKID